jgi:hypothetical protein
MARPTKRRNPSGHNAKEASPRRGEKIKQTKVTQAKEMDPKGARQTKLAFSSTVPEPDGNNTTIRTNNATIRTNNDTIPNNDGWKKVQRHKLTFAPDVLDTPTKPATTEVSHNHTTDATTPPSVTTRTVTTEKRTPATPSSTTIASRSQPITPEGNATSQRLNHPTPPTTPERNPNSTQDKRQNKQHVNTNTPYEEADDDDDNNKKPAASTKHQKDTKTNTHTNDGKQTDTKDTSEDANDTTKTSTAPTKKKKAKRNKYIEDRPTTGTYNSPHQYRAIRYNGIIETPPSNQPLEEFLTLLKAYFQVIQDVLGKDIFIAAWDSEQEHAFSPIKDPKNMPASRESLAIYFATYVNPRAEGSKIYLNLRLITFKPHHVPLHKFGMELS